MHSKFKVCKSVHHHTIQINQPTRYNIFSSLLLDVYVHLNMFQQPLVLPLERGESSAVGRGRPDHDQQHCYHHAPTSGTTDKRQRQLLSWWMVDASIFEPRTLEYKSSAAHSPPLHSISLYFKKDRQCTYTRNDEASSFNHCCHGKGISITNSECVSIA